MTLNILILLFVNLGQINPQTNQFELVLKSPEKFNGQEIEIEGVFRDRHADRAIYLTGTSDKSKAIWVDFSEIFLELNTFDKLDGQKIRIRGTFYNDKKGRLRNYCGTIIDSVIIVE